MYLETNLEPLQVLSLTILRPDPSKAGYGIVLAPFNFQEAGLQAMYVRNSYDTATVLIPLGAVIFLPDNQLRIPFDEVPSSGTAVRVVCDFGCDFRMDFLDRFLVDGHTYVEKSLVVTNTSNIFEYVRLCALSVDLDFALRWPYPYVFPRVAYTNGTCSPALTLFDGAGVQLSDICVFFNSAYIGRLAGLTGNVDNAFSSPKSGKVEFLRQGKLQFALSGSSDWLDILTVDRLQPEEQITVKVCCDVQDLSPIRYLNAIKLFATEEIT
jgi:hypothetical protein